MIEGEGGKYRTVSERTDSSLLVSDMAGWGVMAGVSVGILHCSLHLYETLPLCVQARGVKVRRPTLC